MPTKTVLVALPVEDRHREKLEAAGKGCRFVYSMPKTVTAEQVAQANIIIGNVPAGLINASERLELLQLNSAGADQYIKPGVLSESTVLTNATGAYSKAVAEHALALMFSLQKKLYLYRDAQMKGLWTDAGNVVSVSDAVVAVIGLGDIGSYFARLAKTLGAYVIGVKRRPGACPDYVDELCGTDELDQVLRRADVTASFLPGNGSTYHMYTMEHFRQMKPTAYFINCGRGGAVDSQVLYEALKSGEIAAAAVDVTETEPLPETSPLWRLENLVITPHVSGYYHLPETFERIVDIAAENLAAKLEGRALRNVVDLSTGYKK